MHCASLQGHLEVVKSLLGSNPTVDYNSTDDVSCDFKHCFLRRYAISCSKYFVIRELLIEQNGYTALHCASYGGHCEVVKLLLAQPGVDVNVASNVRCIVCFQLGFVNFSVQNYLT